MANENAQITATTESTLLRGEALLEAITRAQSAFIKFEHPRTLFDHLLTSVLDVTASEYGFIGEVLRTKDGKPYLKAHALTNIAWNDETLALYEQNAASGLEFYNLDTLFGAGLTSGTPIVSNSPSKDPRRGGLPDGHPPLNSFLGIPLHAGRDLVGMVGIANRPGGYNNAVLEYLKPLVATCANLIMAYRADAARKAAEEALRGSEERLRRIFDTAVDAIVTVDDAGLIQGCNPATERLFGFTADELVGNDISILMPRSDREMIRARIAADVQCSQWSDIGIHRDVLGQRKDGSTFPLHLTVSEAAFGERKVYTGIARDISPLVKAREELNATLDFIRKSRDDLRAILDRTRIGSIMLDSAGIVQYVSAACRRLLAAVGGRYNQMSWEEFFSFDASLKGRIAHLMKMHPDKRERVSTQIEVPNNKTHWVEIEVYDDPRDESGKIIFMYDVTVVHDLRLQLDEYSKYYNMIGKSEPMRRLFHTIADLSKVDVTVLIEGETGTGKEMVAQAIHASSARSGRPFVAVNCASLAESLLSSQLFGHRRGAFTGAISDQVGVFERANGGTVFLDEIGDISSEVQKSLLRVLQEKEITPLGESLARKIDVRIVAATHRDLKAEIVAGRFRSDLFYRIRVAPVTLPPLRERRTDIPLLAMGFLGAASAAMDRPVEKISADAMDALVRYSWPGNVRELQNAIDFAVVRCRTRELLPEHLPDEVTVAGGGQGGDIDPVEAERLRIQSALDITSGNRAAAARSLGVSRATFYRRLAELGIGDRRARFR